MWISCLLASIGLVLLRSLGVSRVSNKIPGEGLLSPSKESVSPSLKDRRSKRPSFEELITNNDPFKPRLPRPCATLSCQSLGRSGMISSFRILLIWILVHRESSIGIAPASHTMGTTATT
jgi:hypothetical protein